MKGAERGPILYVIIDFDYFGLCFIINPFVVGFPSKWILPQHMGILASIKRYFGYFVAISFQLEYDLVLDYIVFAMIFNLFFIKLGFDFWSDSFQILIMRKGRCLCHWSLRRTKRLLLHFFYGLIAVILIADAKVLFQSYALILIFLLRLLIFVLMSLSLMWISEVGAVRDMKADRHTDINYYYQFYFIRIVCI